MNLKDNYNIYSICFTSRDTGYAVGEDYSVVDDGLILKTTDGGLTWKTQNTGIRANFNDVFFVDAITGYAVGGNSVIKTTSGGEDSK